MKDTRQRILETARGLFNLHGVHRVGVREVARAARMSPGNLAYHFPTKDDLVSALVLELHQLNAREVFSGLPPAISLLTLYQSAVAVMRNMLPYRFILRSYVDAVQSSPQLLELTVAMRKKRLVRHEQLVSALVKGQYVKPAAISAQGQYLFEQSELISSGWLNAATFMGMRDDEAMVFHYAKVGIALLRPYCTAKGARQLDPILRGESDESCRRPGASDSSAPTKEPLTGMSLVKMKIAEKRSSR